MIRNSEVANILLLVGIDPAKAPARHHDIACGHVRVLARYIGYRAGQQASKQSRNDYNLQMDDTAILGDFIATRITLRRPDHLDKSLFHDMRRTLALVEGATGYPMTNDQSERKAIAAFLKAVLDDIRGLKAQYKPAGEATANDFSPLPIQVRAPSI
jgi:hypothetical protein